MLTLGVIWRFVGGNTIVTYAVIALIAAGSLWGWGLHKYESGKSAGASQERAAWVAQREEDQAKQLAKAAADQRKIDQIEADNQALEGQLAESQNALEEAIHAAGADQKPALPKSIAHALNGIGH